MRGSHARLQSLCSHRKAGKRPAALSIPEPKKNGKGFRGRRGGFLPHGQAWFPTSASAQTSPASTTLSGWLVLQQRFSAREFSHSESLCKRISWMVAQTIVRQLLSVVKTSI